MARPRVTAASRQDAAVVRPFEAALAAAWPPDGWRNMTVLVAVSGGADSVALLRALGAIKGGGAGSLVVGHFNHRLRPEAVEDARFVADLAESLGLPCETGEADTAATARRDGDGLEAAARHERYAFLQAAAERQGARYVATGHSADDQAETILHHILRGTGLSGLGGMRRVRPLGDAVTLIRPLLGVRRREVLEYLSQIGQPYREDSTNRSLAMTRNRIRHDLLPRLEEDYNPDVVAAILRLAETARDAQAFIERMAAVLLKCAVSLPSPQDAIIDCRALSLTDRHLVRELFVAIWRRKSWPQQAMGFAEWDRLAEMALGEGGQGPGDRGQGCRTFPGGVRAKRDEWRLLLTREPTETGGE